MKKINKRFTALIIIVLFVLVAVLSSCDFACSHNYIIKSEKKATCINFGEIEYECSICGHIYIESIQTKEHDYSLSVVKEATCFESGLNCFTCVNCEDTYYKESSVLTHSYVNNRCEFCNILNPTLDPYKMVFEYLRKNGDYNASDKTYSYVVFNENSNGTNFAVLLAMDSTSKIKIFFYSKTSIIENIVAISFLKENYYFTGVYAYSAPSTVTTADFYGVKTNISSVKIKDSQVTPKVSTTDLQLINLAIPLMLSETEEDLSNNIGVTLEDLGFKS